MLRLEPDSMMMIVSDRRDRRSSYSYRDRDDHVTVYRHGDRAGGLDSDSDS